jgi:broad specificity phosphatase PhoE
MRIYLIRHASPDYPNDSITEQGHLEAKALAQRMAKERLDRLYVSPLGRAIATAKYTAELTGMPTISEPWTQEIPNCWIEHPRLGKLTMWDCPGEDIRAARPYPTQDNWHELPLLSDPNFREQFQSLQRNSDAFLARHGYERQGGRYRCVRPNRDRLAVFCHGGFGLTWLAHLLEISVPMIWSGFWLPPSSVTTILMDERSSEWAVPRCIGVGDVSHLYHAGLPTQPHGIKANFD